MAAADNIHAACRIGDEAAVRRLLEAAPSLAWERDPDGEGWLPLELAADAGHAGVVRLLLAAAPAEAMAAGVEGALPLHRAARSGREAVVALLLEAAPAAAMAANEEGRLPMHLE